MTMTKPNIDLLLHQRLVDSLTGKCEDPEALAHELEILVDVHVEKFREARRNMVDL